MPLYIVRNDITRMHVDAIVNAANNTLIGKGGVDGAIHRAAGPELQEECIKLGGCLTGDAKITGAYRLPARYIIHTVGPIWRGGNSGERELLISCYRKSLELARDNGCESVAFPVISSGTYGYPRMQAQRIAADVITEFLMQDDAPDMTVYIVIFDRESMHEGRRLFPDIAQYIDDNYFAVHSDSRRESMRRNRLFRSLSASDFTMTPPDACLSTPAEPFPVESSSVESSSVDSSSVESSSVESSSVDSSFTGSSLAGSSSVDSSFTGSSSVDSSSVDSSSVDSSSFESSSVEPFPVDSSSAGSSSIESASVDSFSDWPDFSGDAGDTVDGFLSSIEFFPAPSSSGIHEDDLSLPGAGLFEGFGAPAPKSRHVPSPLKSGKSKAIGSGADSETVSAPGETESAPCETEAAPCETEAAPDKDHDAFDSNLFITLEEALHMVDETFSQMVLRLIKEKGMKNSECYKKANLDKKLFSKINSDIHYRPKKSTALSLAVALELSIGQTRELLTKAGLALTHSEKFDIIVEYFIIHKIYDIFTINEALFEYDQPLLGASMI